MIAEFIKLPSGNSKEFIKECLQLINDTLFFCRTVSAAKARYRRHQFINIRSGGLDFSGLQRGFDELPGLLRLEFFLCNDSRQILLLMPYHKVPPLQENIFNIVDPGNKVLDQGLFASQLWAGVHGFPNGNQNLLILAVGVVIFLYQK